MGDEDEPVDEQTVAPENSEIGIFGIRLGSQRVRTIGP